MEKINNWIILDVGWRRGWLDNLLSNYCNEIGIDPVGPVIKYAKELFPKINFYP